MSPEFEANFKVNLWLSDVIKKYLQTNDIDWNHVPQDLKDEINKITYALYRAEELSNRVLKSMDNH